MILGKWISQISPFRHNYRIFLSPNLSLSRLLLQKFAVLFNYSFQKVLNSRTAKASLVGMKNLKGSRVNRIALIVANGPSARDLDWEAVRKYKETHDLDLFLLNYALLDEKSFWFSNLADFLVLSDPEMHPMSIAHRNLENWKRIVELNSLTLITPSHWHGSIPKNECLRNDCLHFNDLSLEGISKNISPLKGRGYSALTAYKALSCANHFDYKRILIIGFDNSGFKDISVSENLNLLQCPGHGLGDYSDPWDCTSHYPNGIGDFLYDYSELFLSLRRCFGGLNVTNLGIHSEVDAFPKIHPEDEFFKLLRRT